MAHLCLNEATTMPADFVADVRAYAAGGFHMIEVWLPKLERYLEAGGHLDDAAALIRDHGLVVPSACFQGKLLLSEGPDRQKALEELRRRLDITEALGCPILIVPSEPLPQPSPRPIAPLYERAARHLAEACDLARPHGISLALEFLRGPNLAATPLTAQHIAMQAERDNAGVLFDTFHFYAGSGKLEDLAQLDGQRLLFVHVNDAPRSTPREALTDKERDFLGAGGFPLAAIWEALKKLGYTGAYSLELFNETVWADDPEAVASHAYRNMVEHLGDEKE